MSSPLVPLRLAAWTAPIAEAATFYPPWALGYYEQAGLDFRWLTADGSPAALDLLERGEADVAFVSCFSFLSAVARGCPVYNLFPRSCFAVFGSSRLGIRRPADLAGRRVGLRSIHSSGAAWLRLLLRLDGSSEDRVETVITGDQGVERLLVGDVDALVGSDAILFDAKRAGLGSPFIFWLDEVAPLPSDVFAVHAPQLSDVGSLVTRFLVAYRRGLRFAVSSPARAAASIARHSVDGSDPRRNRAMLALRLMLSAPRLGVSLGRFNLPQITLTARLLAEHGILLDEGNYASTFSDAILDRVDFMERARMLSDVGPS
jgi:NitT/TauT family transport system substrate-binding protein